jgi:hypothetical protein
MIKMEKKQLARKLRREQIEICLNCEKMAKCKHIGEYVECADFVELKDEVWNITRTC